MKKEKENKKQKTKKNQRKLLPVEPNKNVLL